MMLEHWTNRPNCQAQRVTCPEDIRTPQWDMAENEELLFNQNLCARVQDLRKARFNSAEEMARLLGVPPDRYRKYENRSPMPPYLLPLFAALVGVDLQELLTGRPFRPPMKNTLPSSAAVNGKKRA